MTEFFRLLASWNCSLWVLVTFLVTGGFAIALGLCDTRNELRKILFISAVAFTLGTFTAFFSNIDDIEQFTKSGAHYVWGIMAIIITAILASMFNLLGKRGNGAKIGLMGYLAFTFGSFPVFYHLV